jgi:hypothetical protein
MIRKLGTAGVVPVVLSLAFAGLALALSVTIDGDHTTDEWGVGNSETCTIGDPGCTRIVDDPVDVVGPDAPAYDVANFHATNSATTMYFSIDMYGTGAFITETTWYETASGRPLLTICLDIDNNTSTGGLRAAGNCNGGQAMTGVDFYVTVVADPGDPAAPIVSVRRWNGTSFVANGAGSVGYDLDTDGITEVAIPMTSLGYTGNGLCPISNGAQPCAARMASYYDNGAAPSDDSVPDTDTFTFLFGCNLGGTPCSPTAITLNSMSSNTDAKNTLPLILAGVSVVCAVIAVFLVRRRKIA